MNMAYFIDLLTRILLMVVAGLFILDGIAWMEMHGIWSLILVLVLMGWLIPTEQNNGGSE